MKILLAEDTAELNRAVAAALELSNYDVDRTYDGEQATEQLKSESYDGIILDIMMPKKDGLQVLKELRSRYIMTPVLFLTAKTEIEDRVAGLDAGADDYLSKPFAIKELLARIRSMIRRHDTYEESMLQLYDISLEPNGLILSSQNNVRLSIKEYELMRALILNRDVELTTAFLLEHIWRNELQAQEDTVWLYICYLKNKLSAVGSNTKICGSKGGCFQILSQKEI